MKAKSFLPLLILPLLTSCALMVKQEVALEQTPSVREWTKVEGSQIEKYDKEALELFLKQSLIKLAQNGLSYRYSLKQTPTNAPDQVQLQFSNVRASICPCVQRWLNSNRETVTRNPHFRTSFGHLQAQLNSYRSNPLFAVELRDEQGAVLDRAPVAMCDLASFIAFSEGVWDGSADGLNLERLITHPLYQDALKKAASIRLVIDTQFFN